MTDRNPRNARTVLLWFDRLAADAFGWSGENTISAEWGSRSCFFCRWGARALEFFEEYHCYKAATAAGLAPAEHVRRPPS